MATDEEEVKHVLNVILGLKNESPLELFLEQHGFNSIALLLASHDSDFVDARYTDPNGIDTTLPRGYLSHIQMLRALRLHRANEHEPIWDWTKVTKAEYDHFLRHTQVPTNQNRPSDETHIPYRPTGLTAYEQRGLKYGTSWPPYDASPVTEKQANTTETESPETNTTQRDMQVEEQKDEEEQAEEQDDEKKVSSVAQPDEQNNTLTTTNESTTDIDTPSTKQPSPPTMAATTTPATRTAKTTSRSKAKSNVKTQQTVRCNKYYFDHMSPRLRNHGDHPTETSWNRPHQSITMEPSTTDKSTQKLQAMKTIVYHETQAAKHLRDYSKLTSPLESRKRKPQSPTRFGSQVKRHFTRSQAHHFTRSRAKLHNKSPDDDPTTVHNKSPDDDPSTISINCLELQRPPHYERRGALCDRGANGFIFGDDVNVIHSTDQHVDVPLDGRPSELPIVDAAGLTETTMGPVILIMNHGALRGSHTTVLAPIQMEAFGILVDDKSHMAGGHQCIRTHEGYVIPIHMDNGLPFIPLRKYTLREWYTLPHVPVTHPSTWNPASLSTMDKQFVPHLAHGRSTFRYNGESSLPYQSQIRIPYGELQTDNKIGERHDNDKQKCHIHVTPTQPSPYVNDVIKQHHTLWKTKLTDSQYDHDTSDDSESTTTPDGVEYTPYEHKDMEHDESSDTDNDEAPELEPARFNFQVTALPTSVQEAMFIDKVNGNHRWRQALDNEIKHHGSYGTRISALRYMQQHGNINMITDANAKDEQGDTELQKQEDDDNNTATNNDYENKLSNASPSI